MTSNTRRPDTILVHAGRDPHANHGVVNPPVYHASTILFSSMEALHEARAKRFERVTYGRVGTPTSWSLERAVAELEGGFNAVSVSSGAAAIAVAVMAFTRSGDHILVADTVYGPTRHWCSDVMTRYGVEVTYYDPLIGAGIADLVRDNTSLIYLESPGSLTFEVQDAPAIAKVARRRGIVTMIDNTWATPLFFRPFDHGIDISVHAATKYIVGHSDVMMGIVTAATEEHWRRLKQTAVDLGNCSGPDDIYLAQRGLRTMGVRLRHHQEAALEMARWLQSQPHVVRVLHPALPDHPTHDLWRRDFLGASGLFSIIVDTTDQAAIARLIDHMELFGLGYSWGGYESLLVPQDPVPLRTATRWRADGQLLRLHIGLEDIDDLKADLAAGLKRLGD
ncbi:MAG: cystathionine beta-lyase [Azospirillaceae bacterium]